MTQPLTYEQIKGALYALACYQQMTTAQLSTLDADVAISHKESQIAQAVAVAHEMAENLLAQIKNAVRVAKEEARQ